MTKPENRPKAHRWPSERSSRRVGWTEGPGVVLADGKTWFFPKIDDSLIPSLRPLVVMAIPTKQILTAFFVEGIQDDFMAKQVNEFFAEFVIDVLKCQYRNRDQTLSDLVFGRREDFDTIKMSSLFRLVASYAADLVNYSASRLPVADDREKFREWVVRN